MSLWEMQEMGWQKDSWGKGGDLSGTGRVGDTCSVDPIGCFLKEKQEPCDAWLRTFSREKLGKTVDGS